MIALLALLGLLTPAPPVDCGYAPVWKMPTATEVIYPNAAGCGVAPQTPDAWRSVTSIKVVRLVTGPDATRVELVFLNKGLQRVVPVGRSVRYDMRLTRKAKGKITLTADAQRDGVFLLDLPPGRRTGKCDVHLILNFQNTSDAADKPISHWLDDWLLEC